jgi:hypothetical protein
MLTYLALAGVVFGVNLLPAFGPPTWSLLVFFRLQSQIPAIPLVLIGALAAATGRLVLAVTSRRFRGRLSAERLEQLAAARDAISGGRKRALAGLGLFALSPLPSAQLFVAAGLLAAPIVALTAAFFAGRLVSYSLYVAAASAAKASLGSIVANPLTSPAGIALQVAMLAALVALVRIDWARLLVRGRARSRPQDGNDSSPTGARRAHTSRPSSRVARRAAAPGADHKRTLR